ncbi:hypothetical protein DRW41_12410 [Neobacillus piezotolerans]|uniref:Uncharacterized protein n=1 Tax=Neobacillus piezotolerans TaxID=2259171 RepID=A0A3D8GQL6_9BACI|nr:hypothetical protein [Neobacillus piezotolerans]RDU36336.1 hypothetical protein DRW41_12410 [Neobacillus piezotolerans]
MNIEKYILAVVTTKMESVSGGACVFHCESAQKMDQVASTLEAILDGIAHSLSEDTYIIVKH